ncbi:AMP-binding protein [Caenimonas soli]|uniref:AMP-binding protein n=1 Tax=Caenimonas soli TaxID=2735555 RepID=UPI00155221F0|nr:AMP-binding protein [Caenimonas soli]NPC57050.1 AMP-binding protein [Caenimonas soli]
MKTSLGTDPLPGVDGSAPLELLARTRASSRTIASAIAGWAARDGTTPALVSVGSQQVTFSELAELTSRVARQLAEGGVRTEHRVGLLVPPGMPGGQLAVALASITTLVPINPALKPEEVIDLAVVTGLHAIVIPRWLKTEARSAILQRRMTVFDAVRAPDGTLGLELLTAPAGSPAPLRPAVEADVAVLLRSSGTTGTPKLIPVTHGNLSAMADTHGSDLWFRMTAVDRPACTAPLYYAAGLKSSLFVPLLLGATVVFPPPEQVFELAEWIDELAPTYLSFVAPAALQRMIERMMASPRQVHVSSLRFVMCAGSYLPDQTRATAEALLHVPVLEFYGLSESGTMASNPAPPGKAKPGTVGLPPPGELLVVDANRQPVASGTVGEIMICGPTVMPGYVTNDDSAPYGLQGGWLLTGDLGRLDEDGYLTILGRNKELINRGGEKVSPYEIEKVMLQHPAVLEAAAFGVPHPRLGENVAAAVVLKPGNTALERELKEFLAARLAAFKLPRRIGFLPALPRGGSGKILRRSLSQAYPSWPREVVPPDHDYLLHLELRDLWQRLLGTQEIGLDDDFFDIGGDSLLATDMLVEVEALVGKPYPQSELSTLTIRRMAEVFASDMPAEPQVMTQVKEGTGIPLFFCHGDYVERGFYAQKLAAMIPGDHPIFLLHCYPEPFGSSVDEIARVYMQHILRAAPRSPVLIAGFCNSGMVAWQLAYTLRCAGVEVLELLLIEMTSLNARPAIRALPAIFNAAGALIPGRAGRFVREHAMRHCWRWIGRFGAFSFGALRKKITAWREQRAPRRDMFANADRTYGALMSRYVPPPIDVGVTCIIAQQGKHFETDPRFWRRLAPSVSTMSAPGTHQGVLVTGRQALANGIAEMLQRAASAAR